jgi:hypothetical protein
MLEIMRIDINSFMIAFFFCRIFRKEIILRPDFEKFNTKFDYKL